MSTTASAQAAGGPYVARDLCDAFRGEQREAHARTWQEIRTLRRLVILLVVGGQLFSGGLNAVGFTYWLEQHAAQPHAATVEMLAAIRAEVRDDLRDLRRELHDFVALVVGRDRGRSPAPDAERESKGDTQ